MNWVKAIAARKIGIKLYYLYQEGLLFNILKAVFRYSFFFRTPSPMNSKNMFLTNSLRTKDGIKVISPFILIL